MATPVRCEPGRRWTLSPPEVIHQSEVRLPDDCGLRRPKCRGESDRAAGNQRRIAHQGQPGNRMSWAVDRRPPRFLPGSSGLGGNETKQVIIPKKLSFTSCATRRNSLSGSKPVCPTVLHDQPSQAERREGAARPASAKPATHHRPAHDRRSGVGEFASEPLNAAALPFPQAGFVAAAEAGLNQHQQRRNHGEGQEQTQQRADAGEQPQHLHGAAAAKSQRTRNQRRPPAT